TGAGRMEAFFFGTISGKVLEEAHCPVIVVPQTAKFDGAMDHLGVTTNFSEDDARVIEAMRKFRDQLGSRQLHIIHFDTSESGTGSTEMDAFCQPWQHDKKITRHCIQHTDVNEALEKVVSEQQIDVLAMMSEKRSWFDELFQTSRAKALSYHQSIPLMVFQKENLHSVKG